MRMKPAVGKRYGTYNPSQGRNASIGSEQKEVDLVPIMNLFVTLIPMLLSMVVLVSIAYISLDLNNPNASGNGNVSPELAQKNIPEIRKLELVINVIDGEERFYFNRNDSLDVEIGEIPASKFSDLSTALVGYRTAMLSKREDTNSEPEIEALPIIITPKDYVKFGLFVKTMDLCKKLNFTDIMIGEI